MAPDVAVSVVALAGLTVKAAELPVMRPWVAVSAVVWASARVIEAELSIPAVKVKDDPVAQAPLAG